MDSMRLARTSTWLLVGATFLATSCIFATVQTTPIKSESPASGGEQPHQSPIQVNSNLVDLPVSVTDHQGNFVENLPEEDFQVFDDGHPQKISLFEPRDSPVTVGLVVDHSGSMSSKL